MMAQLQNCKNNGKAFGSHRNFQSLQIWWHSVHGLPQNRTKNAFSCTHIQGYTLQTDMWLQLSLQCQGPHSSQGTLGCRDPCGIQIPIFSPGGLQEDVPGKPQVWKRDAVRVSSSPRNGMASWTLFSGIQMNVYKSGIRNLKTKKYKEIHCISPLPFCVCQVAYIWLLH